MYISCSTTAKLPGTYLSLLLALSNKFNSSILSIIIMLKFKFWLHEWLSFYTLWWSLIRINFLHVQGEEHCGSSKSFKTSPGHLKLSHSCRSTKTTTCTASQSIEIPSQWYNVIADLPVRPPPALHPKTYKPVTPQDWSPLFPEELIKQENSDARFIDIPKEVIDVYELWRPTPLIR